MTYNITLIFFILELCRQTG